MAGVFDFGTRFGEGYMAGSQLTAQREAKKAQQMNSDRDFALRESQAVIESERANLRDEMARQGLRMQEDSLQYGKQRDIDQRQFQSGEAEKQRTFQGARYDQDAKLRKRGQDVDMLKAIQQQLQLDPGNEDLKNQARDILRRMRAEDGMPMPAPSAAPQQSASQPPPAPAAPPTGLRLDMQDNPATRVGLRPYSGPAIMAGLGQAAVRTGAQAGGAVTEFMDTMPTTPQPSREPGPGRMLPARALDAGALIPGQGPSIPGGFVGPPPQSPGVLNQAYRWLERAATPTQPQAQQSMPSLAPVSGTSTSSSAGSPQEDRLFRAIVQGESRGNPNAVNPHSGALGVGQVMPENVPVWTSEVLGKAMTPAEFKADPVAQEKVVRAKLAEYLKEGMEKTGQESEAVRYAAAKWYSGHGSLRNDSRPQKYGDGDYPSIKDYSDLVERRYLASVEQ